MFAWLTPELAFTVGTLLVSIASAFAGIKSDVRELSAIVQRHTEEISAVTQQASADRELLLELKGDIKLIRAMLEQPDRRASR
jgi:hypothetical protein